MYSIRNVFFLFIIISPFLAYGNLESLSNDLSSKALKESETDIDTAMLLSQQSVVADPKNAKAWAIAAKIYLLNKDLSSAERLPFILLLMSFRICLNESTSVVVCLTFSSSFNNFSISTLTFLFRQFSAINSGWERISLRSSIRKV